MLENVLLESFAPSADGVVVYRPVFESHSELYTLDQCDVPYVTVTRQP